MQTEKQKQATTRNWCKKGISSSLALFTSFINNNESVLSENEILKIKVIQSELYRLLSSWNKG
jgi:hypothetical protein